MGENDWCGSTDHWCTDKNGATRLTYEVLTTLTAEVMAVMNTRRLEIPSSATLLTLKASGSLLPYPQGTLNWITCVIDSGTKSRAWQTPSRKGGSRSSWQLFNPRGSGPRRSHNLQDDDVVLIKNFQAKRNKWPLGLVVKAIPSSDSKVRKVKVKTLS